MLRITLAALVAHASAQYINGSAIASCADLGCPMVDQNVADCRVQGHDYTAAGMVSFKTPLQDLTWTVGSTFAYPNDSLRYPTYVKDYYLGTPNSLDLSQETGYHGCAAFFVDSNASFPVYQQPGQCGSAIGDGCVTELQRRASEAASGASSSSDLCSRLQSAFDEAAPSECSLMRLYGSQWGRVKFRELTGDKAPMPASQMQNASSNCHPVIPSTYRLANALNFNATSGNGTEDSIFNSSIRGVPSMPSASTLLFVQLQAVPIVSVFSVANGTNAVSVAVSCLDTPVRNLITSTPQKTDTGIGATMKVPLACTMLMVLLSALFLML